MIHGMSRKEKMQSCMLPRPPKAGSRNLALANYNMLVALIQHQFHLILENLCLDGDNLPTKPKTITRGGPSSQVDDYCHMFKRGKEEGNLQREEGRNHD